MRNPRNYTVRRSNRGTDTGEVGRQDITNVATISKPGVTTKSASVTVQVRSVTPPMRPGIHPYAKPVPALYENGSNNVLLLLDTSGSMTYESDSEDSTYGDAPSRWLTALLAASTTTARTRTAQTTQRSLELPPQPQVRPPGRDRTPRFPAWQPGENVAGGPPTTTHRRATPTTSTPTTADSTR